MANEIQIALQESGLTVYAALRNPAGGVWSTASNQFESVDIINWTDADIPLAEQGSTGDYFGDWPTTFGGRIGTFMVEVFVQSGAAPVRKDDLLVANAPMLWNEINLYHMGDLSVVDYALKLLQLHLLVKDSIGSGAAIGQNSIIANIVSSAAPADWSTFDNTTDSLQAIRDRGDAAW